MVRTFIFFSLLSRPKPGTRCRTCEPIGMVAQVQVFKRISLVDGDIVCAYDDDDDAAFLSSCPPNPISYDDAGDGGGNVAGFCKPHV